MTSSASVVNDMLQMADDSFRNANYIERKIMSAHPIFQVDYLYGMACKDEGEKWELSKEKMKDYIVVSNDTDATPIDWYNTSIWKKNEDKRLELYFMSEILRCLVENYKTPVLEYKDGVPVRSAEFEAMMYEMFKYYFNSYDGENSLEEDIFNRLFFDMDWEIPNPNNSPQEGLVLSSLGINRDYFFKTPFEEIMNYQESLDWLFDYCSDYF